MVAGAATIGAGILAKSVPAFSQESNGPAVTKGDIAILRFLAAAEIIESDLWEQYTELGGTQDDEESGVNGGSPLYMQALQILDGDMPQYIHDNTDDEKSHFAFINSFLESVGADPVDLTPFATLPSSKATGARDMGRLTNLMNLNVDTASGRAIAAPRTILTSIRISFLPRLKTLRIALRFLARMTTLSGPRTSRRSTFLTISKPSPSPPDFTSARSNKAVVACIPRLRNASQT